MKPGKLSCVGLVGIMMVLPDTLWNLERRQARVKVVVRMADVGAPSDETSEAPDSWQATLYADSAPDRAGD